jgi:hypothetical protein
MALFDLPPQIEGKTFQLQKMKEIKGALIKLKDEK